MKIKELSNFDYRFFSYLGLFFIVAGLIAYVLALLGLFYLSLILVAVIISGIFIFLLYFKKEKHFSFSREFIIILASALAIAILFSFFVTPSVFSGRDQGSISEAAARLSQNHTLYFHTAASDQFFKIYGPGPALNFPGFYYTANGSLITQFPAVYIAWLALFFSFWGINGLILANAVLFFIFLVSFYLLARLYISPKYSIFLLLITASSFPFFWFFKFTLSENMALALLWFFILELVLFLKNTSLTTSSPTSFGSHQQSLVVRDKEAENYGLFLFSAGLLFFSRIEGPVFVLAALVILYVTFRGQDYFKEKSKLKFIFLPLIIFGAISALAILGNFYFYRELVRTLVHSNNQGDLLLENNFFVSLWDRIKIFWLYGVIGYLIIGIWGIISLWRRKKYQILTPLFVVLPAFIYLISPKISSDHPWLLRRFVFSIFPVLIFYAVFLLDSWKNKKIYKQMAYGIIVIIFIFNLWPLIKYFTFSENKNLLKETAQLSQNFTEKDLVLVDQKASGDGWSMITGPLSFLYDQNAVYFFNSGDLNKIDFNNFERVFLIAPNNTIDYYKKSVIGNRLIFFKNYSFATRRLDTAAEINFNQFLNIKNVSVSGKIFEIKK